MSNLIKFELNQKGVGELLNSDAMADVLMDYANQVKENAGEGYEVVRSHDRVKVVASTQEAAEDNMDNNTLLKARR